MIKGEPIRVLCIDDHPLIHAGVQAMLGAEPDMSYAGGARTAEEGIELFRQQRPDVTLMDLRLPRMQGIAAITQIKKEFPSACIIALSSYKGDDDIHRALEAGARSYLLKDVLHKELIDAIRKVSEGGRCIAPEAAQRLDEYFPHVGLTQRELEVLQRFAAGLSNREIAGILGVSEETVKFHAKSVFGKLGVNDRTHAVTVAIKRGILHLD